MKISAELLELIRKYPQYLPLPLEPLHGWRSSPDEGGHTHCRCCGLTILPGDPVVGRYHEYTSVVFCPECVGDNPELFREWLKSERNENASN
jgi:hypothetical protein